MTRAWILGAGDPMPPSELLWGLLPRPLAVAFAILIAISWVIADVTGKLGKLGPIYKSLRKHQAEREAQNSGWRERDAEVVVLRRALEQVKLDKDQRVAELKETLGFVNDQVDILKRQQNEFVRRLKEQERELNLVHRMADAQYHAIRRHMAWDRQFTEKARDMGMTIEDPPTLYIAPEEVDPRVKPNHA
jgi:hypothetical protein